MSFKRLSLTVLISLMPAILISAILLKLYPAPNLVVALIHVKSQPCNMAFLDPQQKSTPREHELFQKNQLKLLKSEFVLRSALSARNISQLEAVIKQESDSIVWLRDQLQVSFPDGGEFLELRYEGTQDVEELKKIINAVIVAYKNEVIGRENIDNEDRREKLLQLHHSLESECIEKLNKYYRLSEELESPKPAETGASAVAAGKKLNEVRAELREFLIATDDAKEDAAIQMVDSLVEAMLAQPEQATTQEIRHGELTLLKGELDQLSELSHELAMRLRKWNMGNRSSGDRLRILQPATAEENIGSAMSYRIAAVGGLATFVVAGLGLLLVGPARGYQLAALGGLATLVVAGLGLLLIFGFIK